MTKKIICITGMPGSGKGVVAHVARNKGLPVFVMGDVVREEATRRGLPHKPEILNMIAKELREKEGLDAIAKRLVAKIKETSEDVVAVDGVRSLHEVNVFKKYGEVVIIAVHASPKTRFKRILSRRRPGDPKTWEEFVERDFTELGFGIGNVIALADYMIVNEGDVNNTINTANKILDEVLGVG